jgi:Ca2+-dependent lipid-binding protein
MYSLDSGQSDPYVVCTLGRQQFKTNVIDDNLNPVWNQTLMLSWDGHSPLYLHVIDKDYLKTDGESPA